jgi:hypothetical protein
MSLLSQMIDAFKSTAFKESLYKALEGQGCTLEKDKLLKATGNFKADLYIETEDVIYLVKTVEKYNIEPLSESLVEELGAAKKNLASGGYKHVVPVVIIGQNPLSHPFLEGVYRNQVLMIQGAVEECAAQLEFILQHQVVPSYQMTPRIGDEEVRFYGI